VSIRSTSILLTTMTGMLALSPFWASDAVWPRLQLDF